MLAHRDLDFLGRPVKGVGEKEPVLHLMAAGVVRRKAVGALLWDALFVVSERPPYDQPALVVVAMLGLNKD